MRLSADAMFGFHRTPTPSRRGVGAFTLFELILILVIIGALSAIVAPSLGGLRSKTRLDSIARTLAAMVNEARNRAIIEARPYRVWIDTVEHTCWLEGMTEVGFTRPESSHGQKVQLDLVFEVESRNAVTEATGFAVRFEPDGRGELITIVLNGDKDMQRVVYAPSVTEPYRVFDPDHPDEVGEGSTIDY